MAVAAGNGSGSFSPLLLLVVSSALSVFLIVLDRRALPR
jgi:hypothetical protein